MTASIRYAARAQRELEHIRAYIEREFGEIAALKFLKKIDQAMRKIAAHPYSNPTSPSRPTLRKCLVKPYTLVLYQIVTDKAIEVVALIDSRRNLPA